MNKKVRVWCPTSKHFSTMPWLSCDGLQLKWEHTGNVETLTDIRFDTYVIQHFTGLLDKKNVEIYEGDIISYTPFNQQDYKNTIVEVPQLDKFHWFAELQEMLLENNKCDIQIIGNIFETPDILKK